MANALAAVELWYGRTPASFYWPRPGHVAPTSPSIRPPSRVSRLRRIEGCREIRQRASEEVVEESGSRWKHQTAREHSYTDTDNERHTLRTDRQTDRQRTDRYLHGHTYIHTYMCSRRQRQRRRRRHRRRHLVTVQRRRRQRQQHLLEEEVEDNE